MKVWEYMNKLKGTDATKEQILNWLTLNKLCPLVLDEQELELEAGVMYPNKLYNMAANIFSGGR